MPTVEVQNPFGLDTPSEFLEFPEYYSTSMMEDEVRQKFPNKAWPDKEEEDPYLQKGFWGQFAEAYGDSWDQAKYDLAVGSAILRSDDSEAFMLLEDEYQKWKEDPDEVKDYEILSGGFVGEVFGSVSRDIAVGFGVGAATSIVATPIAGLWTGSAAVATMQGTTAKGGSMRNTYISQRYGMDQKGDVDLQKAFEIARRVSNTDAVLAVGEAGLATMVPVARLTPGLGRSVVSKVGTKVGAELAFDASIGAGGSVLSDLYAESEGIDRGDKLENAFRSGLQEVIGGGIPTAIRGFSAWGQEVTARKWVQDRLKENEGVPRLQYRGKWGQEAVKKATAPRGPTKTWVYPKGLLGNTHEIAIPNDFNWDKIDLDKDLDFGEQDPVGEADAGRRAVWIPIRDENGEWVGARKATREEVEELKKAGKNPNFHYPDLADTEGNIFIQHNGQFFKLGEDGSIVSLVPARPNLLNPDGEVLPHNPALLPLPDFKSQPKGMTWKEVVEVWEELVAEGMPPELASIIDREKIHLTQEDLHKEVPKDLEALVKRWKSIRGSVRIVPSNKKAHFDTAENTSIAIPFSNFSNNIRKYGGLDSASLSTQLGTAERIEEAIFEVDKRIAFIAENETDTTYLSDELRKKVAKTNRDIAKWETEIRTGKIHKIVLETDENKNITGYSIIDTGKPPIKPSVREQKLEQLSRARKKLKSLTIKKKDAPKYGEHRGIITEPVITLPSPEQQILIELLSDPENPDTGPYPHKGDPSKVIEIDGIKHINANAEHYALTKLASSLKLVLRDQKQDTVDIVKEDVDAGRITNKRAAELLAEENIVQENPIDLEAENLSIPTLLAQGPPKEFSFKGTDFKNKPLIHLEIKKFTKEELFKKGVPPQQQKDVAFEEAMNKDIANVINNVNTIEDIRWYSGNVTKEKFGHNLPKDLKDEATLTSPLDLENRISDIQKFLVEKGIKTKVDQAKNKDNRLSQQKEENIEEIGKVQDKFMHDMVLSKKGAYKGEGQRWVKQIKSPDNPNTKNSNTWAIRKEIRHVMAGLRKVGDVNALGMNMFFNPAAIPQVFKALVKLAIAILDAGVKTVKDFARAIRQSPDNEAVQMAWDDAGTGRIRPIDSLPRRIIKAIMAILKGGENKTEQKQISNSDSYVDTKWETFLNRHSLQQFKDRGIVAPVKALFKRTFLHDYYDLADIMARVGRGVTGSTLEEKLASLPDAINAHMKLDAMESIVGELGFNLDKHEQEFHQALIDSGITPEELTNFLLAKHAEEANAHLAKINPDEFGDPEKKGGSGITNGKAREILEKFGKENKLTNLQNLADTYVYSLTKSNLDLALKYRLIDAANHKRLSTYYKNYVPLRGREGSDPIMQSLGSGLDVRGEESMRRMGRESRPTDIIPYIFQQYHTTIVRGERNKVLQSLMAFITENPNDEITLAHPDYVRKIKKRKGMEKVKWVRNPRWTEDTDLVGFKVDGKQYYLQIQNAALAHQMRSSGVSGLAAMTRPLGQITRVLSKASTSWNPAFVIPNFIRDITFAKINLTAAGKTDLAKKLVNIWNLPGLIPGIKYVPGLGKLVQSRQGIIWDAMRATWRGEDPLNQGKELTGEMDLAYQEMKKYGGKIAFHGIETVESKMNKLQDVAKKINALSKKQKTGKIHDGLVKSFIMGAKEMMEDTNTAVETATRLATYKLARDSGATAEQAAYLARNITINFTRRGTLGTGLNNMYMFYNAGAQGSYIVYNSLVHTKKGKKIAFNIALTGFALEMFNQLFSGEDEEGISYYDKIPEWKKKTNFIFINPITGKDAIAFPMPYGYNVLHYMGAKAYQAGRDGYLRASGYDPSLSLPGAMKPAAAALNIMSAAADSFNPIGGSTSLLRSITPDVGDIVVDLTTNRDWKGAKIWPEPSPFAPYDTPNSYRHWNTVRAPFKAVAQGLNSLTGGNEVASGSIDWSPEALEQVAKHFTGGVGQTLLRVEKLFHPSEYENFKPNDVPIARRFLASPSSFYELEKFKLLREKSYQAADLHKLYIQNGKTEEAKQHRELNKILFQIHPTVKITESIIRKTNKSIRLIGAAKNMDASEKATKISRLKQVKNAALRRAHSRFIDFADPIE